MLLRSLPSLLLKTSPQGIGPIMRGSGMTSENIRMTSRTCFLPLPIRKRILKPGRDGRTIRLLVRSMRSRVPEEAARSLPTPLPGTMRDCWMGKETMLHLKKGSRKNFRTILRHLHVCWMDKAGKFFPSHLTEIQHASDSRPLFLSA